MGQRDTSVVFANSTNLKLNKSICIKLFLLQSHYKMFLFKADWITCGVWIPGGPNNKIVFSIKWAGPCQKKSHIWSISWRSWFILSQFLLPKEFTMPTFSLPPSLVRAVLWCVAPGVCWGPAITASSALDGRHLVWKDELGSTFKRGKRKLSLGYWVSCMFLLF